MVNLNNVQLATREQTDTPPAAEFTKMLADGYFACASVPVDMVSATAALEAIRHAAERNPEAFPVRRELNDQIGRAEDDRVRAVLSTLRTQHQAWTVAAHSEWSPRATYAQWLDRFARAIEDWYFEVCRALLENPPEVPAQDAAAVQALEENVGRMLEDDWNLARDTFAWLGDHPAVNPETRARMIARLAQVALYFDDNRPEALKLLDKAEQLARGPRAKAEIHSARGQCQMGVTNAAAATLERAAELDPRFVESFAYRGDIARDAGDLSAAELWYRRAIAAHPGSSVGYMHLAQLYCSPSLAPDRARDADRILALADAVEPHGAPEHRATVAEYLIDVGQLDLAEQQAERAVASLPQRGRAHYVRGGINAMQERWAEALLDFRIARLLEPTKYANARFASLGKQEALPLLLQELADDPADYVVQDAIICFAQQTHGDAALMPVALDALQQVERLVDASAHGRIANERGDVYYYTGEYGLAAQEFRKAWDQDPLPVHGTNLVAALRKQALWDEAESVIEAVFAVTGDAAWRAEMRAGVANENAHEFFNAASYAAAAELYDRAASFAPTTAVYLSNLAGALTMWFRQEPSVELAQRTLAEWRKLLELEPNNGDYVARARNFADLAWGVHRFGADALQAQAGVAPLRIFVGSGLVPLVKADDEGNLTPEVSTSAQGIRDWIWEDYGVRLPRVRFIPLDEDTPPDVYALSLFEVITRTGRAKPDMQLVVGQGALELVEALGVEVLQAAHPLSGDPGLWIPDDDVPIAHSRGVPIVSPIDFILSDLASAIIPALTGVPRSRRAG